MKRELGIPNMPHLLLAPLVAFACVAYVFRFSSPLGEISLFRVAMVAYFFCAIWKFLFLRSVLNNGSAVIRLIFGCVLIIIPTVIDLIFFVEEPSLAKPIYAFWANVAFFVLFSLTVEQKHFVYYLKWYCYVAVFEAIISLYSHFTMNFPLDFVIQTYGSEYAQGLSMFNVNDDLVRLSGTFFDPNFYGIYLVSVIASSCWLFFYSSTSVGYLLLAGLSLYQLMLTGSRTALLGLCGVIFATLLIRKANLIKVVGFLLLLAVLGSLPLLFDASLANQLIDGSSIVERFDFFQRGVDAFLANPLFGSGSSALVDPATGISTAHSVYLSILGRNGIFGLLFFLFAVLIIFFPAVWGNQVERPQRDFALQFLLMIGIIFISYDILYFFEPLFFLFAMMFVCTKSGARAFSVCESCSERGC